MLKKDESNLFLSPCRRQTSRIVMPPGDLRNSAPEIVHPGDLRNGTHSKAVPPGHLKIGAFQNDAHGRT